MGGPKATSFGQTKKTHSKLVGHRKGLYRQRIRRLPGLASLRGNEVDIFTPISELTIEALIALPFIIFWFI
jgi:hypothetical protein